MLPLWSSYSIVFPSPSILRRRSFWVWRSIYLFEIFDRIKELIGKCRFNWKRNLRCFGAKWGSEIFLQWRLFFDFAFTQHYNPSTILFKILEKHVTSWWKNNIVQTVEVSLKLFLIWISNLVCVGYSWNFFYEK
jgi:hypothetical protein